MMKRTNGPTGPEAAQTERSRLPRGAKKRAAAVMEALRRDYPDATCALHHRNALELLVATILSAQCTDARVNEVTRSLFRRYRSARAYADAPPGELEEAIRSTGFFNNKARSLRLACRQIVTKHRDRVPGTMEALVALPGVARKTANVVLGTWFGLPGGVVVDTHVRRLAGRMGLTSQADPVKIEQDLMRLAPRDEWVAFGHRLIWHGRRVCQARKPRCAECGVAEICPRNGVER